MHLALEEMAILLHADPTEAIAALKAAAALRLAEDEEPGPTSPEPQTALTLRGRGEILLHLIACPRCRRRLSDVLLTPAVPEENLEAPELTALASKLQAEATRYRRKERDDALPLLQELLRLPPSERLGVLEASETPFRHAGVAELLVDRAEGTMEGDLAEARHLAFLATAIVEALPETPRSSRLLSMAYCTVAEVERRRGALDASEELLANAVRQLAGDEFLHRSRSRLCLILGRHRRDQGRIDEALALFERARSIAGQLGEDDEYAQAALALGWLLLEEFEGDEALVPLWEAYNLLEGSRLEDVLSAIHGLLLASDHAGELSEVPQLLAVLHGLRDLLPSPLGEIRVLRVLARFDAARGDHLRAQEGLGTVFRRLVAERLPLDAAAAALELALLIVENDYPSNDEALGTLLAQLRGIDLPPHIEAVVRFAISRAQRSRKGSALEVLASAEHWLLRARFNPDLPFFPLSEPAELVSWRRMTTSERLHAAAEAGVELRSPGKVTPREPVNISDRRLLAWTHEAMTGQRIVFPEGRLREDETQVD